MRLLSTVVLPIIEALHWRLLLKWGVFFTLELVVIKILRTNTFARNVVLYFVVLLLAAYVLVALGEAPASVQTGNIAKIGSQNITVQDIFDAEDNLRSQYQQFGFNITDEQLKNQVPQSLLRDSLLLQGTEDNGVVVSDDELRDWVINSRKREDGSYLSNEEYAEFVKNRFGQIKTYEDLIRNEVIRSQKFSALFHDATFVSEKEVKELFEKNGKQVNIDMINVNTFSVREQSKVDDLAKFFEENKAEFMTGPQRKIRYVYFENNVFAEAYTPSNEEIQSYFEEHQDKPPFTQEARVQVRHIQLNTDGSNDAEVLAKAQELKKSIDNGLAFLEAVEQNSEDQNTRPSGGTLATMAAPQFTNFLGQAVADAAFALGPDGVSEPVKSDRGYHLLQLMHQFPAVKQSLEDAREHITTTLKNQKGASLAQTEAAAFHTAVTSGKTFEEVATEKGLEIFESDFFDKNNQSQIGGGKLSIQIQVKNRVFAAKKMGEGADLVPLGVAQCVAQWIDEKEPQPLDFEADAERIKTQAEHINGRLFLMKDLERAKGLFENNPEGDIKDILAEFSYLNENANYRTTGLIAETALPFQLTREKVSFQSIHDLEQGAFLGPFQGTANPNDIYLIRLREKTTADPEKFEEERHALLSQLRRQAAQESIAAYLLTAQNEYDPQDKELGKISAVVQRNQ